MALSPEKVLLKWMNFHLKRGGYEKTLTNFSSDLKVYFCHSETLLVSLVWNTCCLAFHFSEIVK